jgi:hypothetical protein
MKFVALIFALLTLSVLPAFSAENLPGEVLAVFANDSVNDITADSLSEGGEHYVWLSDVAEELGAEVLRIYENVSISGNEIMVLLRAKSGDGESLLEALGERQDVKASSLNYIRQRVRHKAIRKGGK